MDIGQPIFHNENRLEMKVVYLRKLFWEMFFGSEDVLSVYGFLKSFLMMITSLNDYVTDDDDDDKDNFGYH